MKQADDRLPVTVISGFLGSGKTTLVNHLLNSMNRRRVAVIENELGEISIDHHLILRTDLGALETVQGRTCCSAREEFLRLLHVLTREKGKFDRVLVETTGVAHPGMVAHAIHGDPVLKEHLRLDGVVTVVDARHIMEHLGNEEGHADEQVAYADLLVINKIDLVSEEEVRRVVDALAGINAMCPHIFAQKAEVPAGKILDIGGFDLKRIESGVSGCSGRSSCRKEPSGHEHHDHHQHKHEIGTISITAEGEMDIDQIQRWMDSFVNAHAGDLFRSKGILAVQGVAERVVFQGVHGMFQMTLGKPWDGAERTSEFVFIGRHLDPQKIIAGLEGCLAPGNAAAV